MNLEDTSNEVIRPINIEDELRSSYINYAMSVIISRALPDVRDGLKPVHRRLVYVMRDLGLLPNRQPRKSAKIIGDCMGRLHPHGDSALYDALVRMAQDWNLRYPLVDGQGNFGSLDGDPPAAMRYTEARMTRFAELLLTDIDRDTVDYKPNFDETENEPVVLPSRAPNLLVNGSAGIAVGMATNVPPHNLVEVVDACLAMIDNPKISLSDLCQIIKGPDFPTGAAILGRAGIAQAYRTGRGRVQVRAMAAVEIDERRNRESIIVSEIPYMLNKASLVEEIAHMVRDKKLEGISDIRDESDRDGVRIVVDLKRGENTDVVLNNLYKHTRMQTTISMILLALVDNRPVYLSLDKIIRYFLQHRREVLVRKTRYDLNQAEARAHILEGLIRAIDQIDAVIALIRGSADALTAKNGLMTRFEFTERQAQAILDMRLQRLTGLERDKLVDEHTQLLKNIEYYKMVLATPDEQSRLMKEDLMEVKEKFGDERRTRIVDSVDDLSVEDLIAEENMVITISHAGYIKRQPTSTYRSQRRGGRGITATTTKDEDFVEHLFVASTHHYLLCFTNTGRLHWVKVYELPSGGRAARGKAVVNLLNLEENEKEFRSCLPVAEFDDQHQVFMVTRRGVVKKTNLSEFGNPRKVGIKAILLDETDDLLDVAITDADSDIVLGTRKGKAIRFSAADVREMGRSARGVIGIRLADDDEVVGMTVVRPGTTVLSVTSSGYGKRTDIEEYRKQTRGGQGVIDIKTGDRNGDVVAILEVRDEDQVMMITQKGIAIRQPVTDVRKISRNTMGVRLIRLDEEDRVVSVAKVKEKDIPNGEDANGEVEANGEEGGDTGGEV